MPSALRQRIQAAVDADLRQRTLFPKRTAGRKYVRTLLGLASVGLLIVLIATYRQSRREVEHARGATLSAYDQRAVASQVKRPAVAGLTRALEGLKGPANDWQDVGGREDLASLVQRRLLYVRGDARELEKLGGAQAIAAESGLDALATCLVSPPANLRESTLLRRIGQVAAGDRLYALSEALLALEFFDSDFRERVRTAEHMQELQRLAARLERPTLLRSIAALDADVLLVAIDEPPPAGVVTDFDGEAAHHLRLVALEVASGRVLFKRRARVDPSWISEKSRLAYSRALDSCRLAYELHQPSP